MSVSSSVSAPASRRLRAASPSVHGGASSLLRLTRASDARLPSSAALSGWVDRAAAMLDLTPTMVGPRANAHPAGTAMPALAAAPHEVRA